ncbi:FkbM family methyltransferase [Streptomyces sp. NPDC002640]
MTSPLIARILRTYVRHAPVTVGKAFLAARILDPHLQNHPLTTVTRLRSGDRVTVSTSDLIQRYQYLFGEWEPHLSAFLRSRLRPGDTFIDVGAHRGAFSLLASHAVGPTGRVVAIEPAPDFHHDLTTAVAANRHTNIRTVQAAVSDTEGEVTLYLADPENLGHTTQVRPRRIHSQFRARTAPLPSIVTAAELATARIIKIDVEGAEAAAVRSLLPAATELRQDVEIAIEIAPRLLTKQGENTNAVIASLHTLGFHPYLLTNDYEPASYPSALRSPRPPKRCRKPITELSDVIFSRTDADELPS